jgi:hypothetical protein
MAEKHFDSRPADTVVKQAAYAHTLLTSNREHPREKLDRLYRRGKIGADALRAVRRRLDLDDPDLRRDVGLSGVLTACGHGPAMAG